MARKPIPKSLRFEVFKRDKFACQYCGRTAPDVILEIDHIMPVSKGGSNDIMNLVTSCRDCNRGKTDRELGDNAAIKKQRQQLEELQERREQLELMLRWREELSKQIEIEINAVDGLYNVYLDEHLTDTGKRIVRKQIMRFGFSEVYQATEYALAKYGTRTNVEKIGGICFNRMKERDGNAKPDS